MTADYQVDRARWASMSIFEQMGNIGSEVGRSLSAHRRGDEAGCMGAVARAIDLFDATVEPLVAARSPRAREVLRAKEVFLTAIFGDKPDDSIEKYFMQFAIATRLASGR